MADKKFRIVSNTSLGKIQEGDVVTIDPDVEPTPGSIVCVYEAYDRDDQLEEVPHQLIRWPADDMRIVGPVRGVAVHLERDLEVRT